MNESLQNTERHLGNRQALKVKGPPGRDSEVATLTVLRVEGPDTCSLRVGA